jgi:hypothetical protein
MTRAVRLAMGQALIEQRSFWRSAEYALFTFVFPLMILLLIGAANVGSYLPGTQIKNTTVFVPGILAFGVIVAAYVNLGSKVAVLRHDGVLKRIKTTPLPSGSYLAGLLASTVATAILLAAGTGLIGHHQRRIRRAGDVRQLPAHRHHLRRLRSHLRRPARLARARGRPVPGQAARPGAAERLRGAPLPGLGPGQPGTVDGGGRVLRYLAFPLAQLAGVGG